MNISLNENLCLKLYEQMVTIRMFEEKTIELFEHNLIRGNVHPCVGQEAVSVGVCSSLRRDDYMLNTHRGQDHCIAKGADLKLMMLSFSGGQPAIARGREAPYTLPISKEEIWEPMALWEEASRSPLGQESAERYLKVISPAKASCLTR